jgi:hypothetical protein
MFTLRRKIYTSAKIFFNIETSKMPEIQDDIDEKNKKDFENEDKKQDGSILQGFGQMMSKFISGKSIKNPEQQNKAKILQRDMLADAASILYGDMKSQEKQEALRKLFGTFKENKDAFPQIQNEEPKQQKEQSENKESFINDLLEVIGKNRIESQKKNANFAKEINNKTQCIAHE